MTNDPLLANLSTLLSCLIEFYIEFVFESGFFWWNILSTRAEGSFWLSHNLLLISNPAIEHLPGDLQSFSSVLAGKMLKGTVFILPPRCFEVVDRN